MNRIIYALTTIFLISIFFSAVGSADTVETLEGPQCTQDDAWSAVVDNAYQIAEDYAEAKNPQSTFMTSVKDYTFIKQLGGEYKGKYLLTITTVHGNDYNVAVLLPLFDVNQRSAYLDTEKPLWKLIGTMLNGKTY